MTRLDPDAVVWQEIDGEIVAIDLSTSEYLSLNAAAVVAWPLLARGTTLDDLVEAVQANFAIPEDRAREDMTEFVTSLRRRRLVTED